MDLTIRGYEPRDLEACRELWSELTQYHRDIYSNAGIGGADPGSHFDTYLEHPKFAVAWVAVESGSVVGLTGLQVDCEEAEIEPVVVRTGHRDRGIGRRLIDHAIAEARRRNLRSVSIRPVARNALAIGRFHDAGFRLLGHIEMFMPLQTSEQAWKPGISIHGKDFGF
ncbi:MAG: GNAT family N-acetyltransferase [Planctomycetota bacterium]|jgi:GNAT superfamily N-acetyltransferase